MKFSQLKREHVAKMADSRAVFKRGEDCLQNGMVSNLKFTGNRLTTREPVPIFTI
ncbi:putative Zn finger protein [Desulfofundulus luciae]|uniref:Zn finger protein n=1 Tax=Desulfofundulus luciae TaxID=74702 RepID=A0ABU0AYH3_9FIRM|nr:putative Zn finger protein [Desulfofundulus luciae]